MGYRVTDEQVINSAAIVADESSAALDISHQLAWTAQIVWTSTTAAGTIEIQESNDGSTWSTISAKTQAISNNSGNVMLKGEWQASKYLRANVDWTSGSITTLTVHIIAKG